MEPIDVVLSLLPSLDEKEKQQVKQALSVAEHSCAKGHKFKKIGVRKGMFWPMPDTVISVCERCGMKIET